MSHQLYSLDETEMVLQRIVAQKPDKEPISAAGIMCASIMVERMLDLSFPPDACAQFAVRCGLGTDPTHYLSLAAALSGRFSLKLELEDEDKAFSHIRSGSKAVVHFLPSAENTIEKFYLLDQIRDETLYIINPSLAQSKGMPRSRKRLIQIKDELMMVPIEHYHTLFEDKARYYVFTL